ncbi:MAG TPA: PAS domain-containing protein [Kofleriaceae bacterium]
MLDDLDDSALDELPFGVVCLSEAMTVVRMNRTESEASGIQRWRAIGRDFFGDVAPGPTNHALAEHVQAFASGECAPAKPCTIEHTFKRRAGADPTKIELVRGRSAGRVYLCIRRD